MKVADIRKKSVSDLTKQVDKLRDEINEMVRSKSASNADKDKFSVRKTRKDLAKVLTVLNEKKTSESDKENK